MEGASAEAKACASYKECLDVLVLDEGVAAAADLELRYRALGQVYAVGPRHQDIRRHLNGRGSHSPRSRLLKGFVNQRRY